MRNIKINLFFALAGILLFSSCKKEADNIYNMFNDVSVTFDGTHPFSVTDYKDYNDGDSVYIAYTITSAKEDMSAVCIRWEGQETAISTTVLSDGMDKRTYTGVYKMRAVRAGENRFRVYALNKQSTYIGDGYKSVVINVKPGFSLQADRRVYLPDSTVKDRACYYSIKRGLSYSYQNGKDVSADLDFGIYRTIATNTTDANAVNGYYYHIYSLSANPLFFNINDISTWTKRETLFSGQLSESALFLNSSLLTGNHLMSSTNIGTIVGTKTINLKETPRTPAGAIRLNSVVYFKTPEGKLGAILFKQITSDKDGKMFALINVKVQN